MAQVLTGSRPDANAPADRSGNARTDAERMDVYRVALEFLQLTNQLMPRRGFADLRDQLERASTLRQREAYSSPGCLPLLSRRGFCPMSSSRV